MFNGTYPSTLHINHYDNMEDINRRKHRLKMKVKGLSHKKNPNQLLVVTFAIVLCVSGDKGTVTSFTQSQRYFRLLHLLISMTFIPVEFDIDCFICVVNLLVFGKKKKSHI